MEAKGGMLERPDSDLLSNLVLGPVSTRTARGQEREVNKARTRIGRGEDGDLGSSVRVVWDWSGMTRTVS